MTTTNKITMNELVELATLDAFGILPPADALKFEQAFMASPAEVQAEIRRIQADFASEDSLLGSEDPSPALRQRVLNAVAQAIETEVERLAPLATIGDKTSDAYNSLDTNERTDVTSTSVLASVWTWRMAALIMLGVAVTFAIFNTSSTREAEVLASNYTTVYTLEELKDEVGPQFTDFINNPNCQQYYLTAIEGDGMIRLAINERSGAAFIMALDLGADAEHSQLRVVSKDGSTHTLAILDPREGFVGQSIGSIDMNLFAAANYERLELIGTDGQILFRST